MRKQEPKLNIEIKGLNENHKRIISSTLCSLEKNLDEAERILNNPPHGKLYAMVDDMTDIQKADIQKRIKLVRECIYKYARQFGLYSEQSSLNGAVRGMFAMRWVDVCELEPDSLRGYGEVGKDIYDTVMNCAKELEELLSHL